MPGAVPLLLVAVLTPAGTWHVGASGHFARAHVVAAAWHRTAEARQATERSIVARGQVRHGAMPASAPATGTAAAPEERRPAAVAAAGPIVRVAADTARARAPPR
jgi:hypothetical protein